MSCLLLASPTELLWRGERYPPLPVVPNVWTCVWLRGMSRIGEWVGRSIGCPYESPGMDGIFPALLQERQEVLIPYLVKIFRACLATGYMPAIWRQVKVVFVPKRDNNSYGGPRDFRALSLTSL